MTDEIVLAKERGVNSFKHFMAYKNAIMADDEVLVKNEWLSLDPYMRGRMNEGKSYVPPFALGKPLDGGAVGEVVDGDSALKQQGNMKASGKPGGGGGGRGAVLYHRRNCWRLISEGDYDNKQHKYDSITPSAHGAAGASLPRVYRR